MCVLSARDWSEDPHTHQASETTALPSAYCSKYLWSVLVVERCRAHRNRGPTTLHFMAAPSSLIVDSWAAPCERTPQWWAALDASLCSPAGLCLQDNVLFHQDSGSLFCWVFPLPCWEKHSPLPDHSLAKNLLHGFNEHNSTEIQTQRSYCNLFIDLVFNMCSFQMLLWACSLQSGNCIIVNDSSWPRLPAKVQDDGFCWVHRDVGFVGWGGEGSKRNETLNETPAPLTPGTEPQKSASGFPR